MPTKALATVESKSSGDVSNEARKEKSLPCVPEVFEEALVKCFPRNPAVCALKKFIVRTLQK